MKTRSVMKKLLPVVLLTGLVLALAVPAGAASMPAPWDGNPVSIQLWEGMATRPVVAPAGGGLNASNSYYVNGTNLKCYPLDPSEELGQTSVASLLFGTEVTLLALSDNEKWACIAFPALLPDGQTVLVEVWVDAERLSQHNPLGGGALVSEAIGIMPH